MAEDQLKVDEFLGDLAEGREEKPFKESEVPPTTEKEEPEAGDAEVEPRSQAGDKRQPRHIVS